MTERITHDLVQGSDEWRQFRLTKFGASEAAAMLGISSKVKRNELLHMKHTCTPQEFSDWVQKNILDYGHEVEALARPIVEEMLGQDLYPVTCSLGILSASCDGLTLDDEIAFEHKQWNADLAHAVRSGVLPDEYQPQCQQIMLVTGAKKVIFVVSDGTRESLEHIEVGPDSEWFDRLIAGWDQFERDLAAYQPRDLAEKPQADAIMALPALAVQIRGEVITSNLPLFRNAAERFIASIKTTLETDQDFADAEATVKFCEAAEKDLEVAKNAAIAQTASIDELMRTVDHIKAQLRDKRLALDKLVTKRKAEIKEEIIADGRKAYNEHVYALNDELGVVAIALNAPDFVAAAKNKRTLASLHEAVDTAVANGKIAADAAAKDLRAKLDWYKETAVEHMFLFRDLQPLIQKPADDFKLAVTTRIAEHKRQEEEREAKRKADEAAAAQPAPEPVKMPISVSAASAPMRTAPIPARVAPAVAAPTSAPTLRLGQINERLAPITMTADGLASLGFAHAATDKSAKLYHEADFARICDALIRHIVESALSVEVSE
ncbi:YqaJ viral recombinase family protein [Caballeronia sp. EK]|uniref:YqaJ viral recombinase family protein n=1 Tax=Caballeronia sp. EK TaxID=2767469 RepID=UPI00165542D4|nr:YqaJ viral recombinase family protein [Caballeronia sp. EK]MBC8642102.1 YqaJ viral recombinase family protein [Caballeronia sp. EK]